MSDIAVNEGVQRPVLPAIACSEGSVYQYRNCDKKSITVTHRFVVPSVFVELLLAEHTTATRLFTRLGL